MPMCKPCARNKVSTMCPEYTQLAEGEGFEPPVRSSRTHDFESRAFDHSATPPRNEECRFTGG